MNMRSLIGSRAPGTLGLAAAVALLTGCDDGQFDYVEFCGTLAQPVQVAPDAYCDSTTPRMADQYGRYTVQLPTGEYDDDTGETSFVGVFIGNPGSPAPAGFRPGRPAGAAPARIVSASTVRASGGTITRGGLGVTSGAKGGSSGS